MSSDDKLPDFDEPHLAAAVEALSEEQVDRLPFGAIRLNAKGEAEVFSASERRLSGFGERPALGHRFFTQIAPCMSKPGYLGRIERALAAGTLDLEFTHVGDFADSERELTVRVQTASGGGYWIFMRRED
jgi:photoactive yellow protein